MSANYHTYGKYYYRSYPPALLAAWHYCALDAEHSVRARARQTLRRLAPSDGVHFNVALLRHLATVVVDGSLLQAGTIAIALVYCSMHEIRIFSTSPIGK